MRIKKAIASTIILIGMAFPLFATSITGWSGQDSLSLTISYVVPNHDIESIITGFHIISRDGETVEDSSGKLRISDIGAKFVNEQDVYVYWLINYTFPVEITLNAVSPLHGAADEIDWVVSWTGHVDGRTEDCLVGGENGYGNECCVFRRTTISKEEEYGYVRLAIETEDVTDKTAGLYSSSLLLTVSQL